MTVGIKDKFIAKTFGGFHIFAQLYDSKYIPESSRFDWDGSKQKAPAVNYFDTLQSNRTTSELNSLLVNPNIPKQFIANTTAGFHIFAQKYDTKYIKYSSLYDWDGLPDKARFRNPIPVDYFDTFESNRTTSEQNTGFASVNNRPQNFIAKTTAGFHIFAQKYDTKYVPDSSIYDWDGKADRRYLRNPLGVDFFDNIGSFNDYRRRTNIGRLGFLDNFGSVEGNDVRDNIGGFAYLKQIGTKDKFIQKTISGFDVFPEHYVSRYIHGASRFDWDGSRDKAPAVNYFDNSNSSNYFIKYVIGGGDLERGLKEINANYPLYQTVGGASTRFDFRLTGATTEGFHTFAQKYDTKYIFNTDMYGWVGNVDRLRFTNPIPVNFFDNHITLENRGSSSDNFDGFSRPGTTRARILNQDGSNPAANPGAILNQLGKISGYPFFVAKTTAGFHIIAQKYDTKYVPDSSIYDFDGVGLNAPAVNYFDLPAKFTTVGFHTFAPLNQTKYIPDSSGFDWNGKRTFAPGVTFFPQLEPKTDHARKIVTFSVQNEPNIRYGRDQVSPPELFKKGGLDPGFRTFFINKNQTAYSPYLSEFSTLATADPYTNFFPAPNGYILSGPILNATGLESTDPSTLGMVTGLLTGIGGFIPYLGTLNRPTQDPSVTEIGATDFVTGLNATQQLQLQINRAYAPNAPNSFSSPAVKRSSIRTKTLGTKFSLIDAKRKTTAFFSWARWPLGQDLGFVKNMSLFRGTLYPIIGPHFSTRDVPDTTLQSIIAEIDFSNLGGFSGDSLGGTSITSQGNVYGVASTSTNNGTSFNLQVEHGSGINKQYPSLRLNSYGFGPDNLDGGQKFLDALLPNSLGRRPWSGQISNNLYSSLQNQYPIYTHDPSSRFYGYRRPNNANDDPPRTPYDERESYIGNARANDPSIWRTGKGSRYERQIKNGWWVEPTMEADGNNSPGSVRNPNRNFSGLGQQDQNAITGNFKIRASSENLVRNYGYIGRWALETGELEKQYKKFDLRKDSYNPDLIWSQPYYVSDIGANWGWGALACGRNSPTTLLDRSLADLQRIGKWMTSGKGILWMLKQFGMQLMNPFVDTWGEPFDIFESRSASDSSPNGTRTTYATNNSLLPNPFARGDGSDRLGGPTDSMLDSREPNVFMPSPTMLYNPLSTIISAVGKGIGLHWQRHWTTPAFGFGGSHQNVPGYQEILFQTQLSAGQAVGQRDFSNRSGTAFTPDPGNAVGSLNRRQNVPNDLNQHYEAQTTYRNKTGFIDHNIGGINYVKRSFHKKANGAWVLPTAEDARWYSLNQNHMASGAGSALASGTAESLDYFEAPTKQNPITRQRRYNRLIGLMKELLPHSFAPTILPDRDQTSSSRLLPNQYGPPPPVSTTGATANEPNSKLRTQSSTNLMMIHRVSLTDSEIIRISSKFGGPGSFFGIGGTIINKSRHKLLGTYTTSPLLEKSLVEEGKQRETFFAQDFYATYKDRLLRLKPVISTVAGTGTGTTPAQYTNELGGDLFAITTGLETRDRNRFGGIYDANRLADPSEPDNAIIGENITIQPITARKISAKNVFAFPYETSENRLRNSTVDEIWNTRRGSRMNYPDGKIASVRANEPIVQFAVTNWYSKHKFGSTTPASKRTPVPLTVTAQGIGYLNTSWTPNRSEQWNDFRWDIEDYDTTNVLPASPRNTTDWLNANNFKFSTHPAIVDYTNNNLETKFGLGNHGKPGSDRGNPRVTNIAYQKVQQAIPGVPTAGLIAPLVAGATGRAAAFRTFPVPVVKPATPGLPGYAFRGDRINIIDYKRSNVALNHELVYEKGGFNNINNPGTDDLIEFYFSSIVLDGHEYCPAEVIVFRAIFDSITDNHKPSWSPVKYMGRGDPLYTYDGYERDVSFNFTVHIGSRDEMKASWRKLNYLAGWTAPEYTTAGFIRAPLCRLNIGNLFRKMPGFINNLSYTFDNTNGTWETAHLEGDRYNGTTDPSVYYESAPGVLQLPKTIQVSVGFTPVGMYRPERYGVFYPLYDDRMPAGDIETGLIPDGGMGLRVNWLDPFDAVVSPGYNPPNATASGDQDAIEYMAVAPGEEGITPPLLIPVTAIP